MPQSDYNLTTVQAVADYLHLPDIGNFASLIGYLIIAATSRIEQDTGRNFVARDYTQRYNGTYQQSILNLDNFPVLSVSRVSYGFAPALTVAYTGTAIRNTVQVMEDRMIVNVWNVNGVLTSTPLVFKTYGSTQLLANAINTITGFSASVNANVVSSSLIPTPGVNLSPQEVAFGYPDVDYWQYTLDQSLGVIGCQSATSSYLAGAAWSGNDMSPGSYRQGQNYLTEGGIFPRGFQNIMVEYRAGYESVNLPPDISQLCNELVADMFNRGSLNINMKSEKLDQYAYELADQTKFTEMQRARLSNWRLIAVGGLV